MRGLILCVDDEADIRQLLDTILKMSGYRTALAATADQALARMSARPDLVLLDINLPDADGIDVCRQVRSESRVPVIFLTAATDARRPEAMSAGGTAFIEKPFDVDELLDLIERLLVQGHERRGGADRRRDAERWRASEQRAGERRRQPRPDGHPGLAANSSISTFAVHRPGQEPPPSIVRSAGEPRARSRSSRGA